MGILNKLICSTSKNEIEHLYSEYGSIVKVAKHFGTSKQTISRLLGHYCIKKTVNLGNKKHFFNEDYFENIDTQDKAYWLGFIMADGCVYTGTGKTQRLQINLKYDDVSHLNKFQSAIGSDYTVQRKTINNSVAALLKINSTKMCNDLEILGVIERKSVVCQFPNIDGDLYNHFIRGYFDGDGCISLTLNSRVHKEFSIIGGQSMMEVLSAILDIKIRSVKDKAYLKVIYTQEKASIIRIYDYLYKDANTFLQRKKRVYDILIYVLQCPL